MNINDFPELKESILKLKEKKYKKQDSAIKNALQDLTNTLDLSDDEILKRAEVLKKAIAKKTIKVLKELEDECMKHPRYYSKKDPLPSEVTELRFWHIPETVKMWETTSYLNDKILQETIHTKKTFWEIFGLVLNKKKSELNEILTTLVPDNQTALWEEWFDIKSINSAVLPTEKKTEEKADNSWDAQSSWKSPTTEDFDKDLLDFFAPKNSTDGENSFPSVGQTDTTPREENSTNEWEEEDISKPGSAYNRIKYLKQILDEREVPFEYRLAIIWTNTPEMRREQSYVAIRIERLDRTVLINNSYGEATYVVTWILDIEDLITFTKKDYQEDQNAVRVRFFSSNPGLWGSQMSEALFSPINKKLKKHIKKQEEAELKKEEDKLKTKKEAISNEKKREEITKFFLKNYGTKIEITKENEKDYAFPEEESNGLNIFTGKKNEQLYIFTEGEERNVYTFTEEDKEKLIMMSHEERRELKITVWGESQGLKATARTFWLKEKDPKGIQKDREMLLSEIIEGGIKSKKEIFKTKFIERLENKFGKNIESFTDEDLEKLVMMTGEERNKAFVITVWGESQSLNKIATAYWVEGLPATNQKDREKLLSEAIWGKIKSKEEITDTLNEEIRKETIKYFNEHYATKKIENWKVIYVFTEEDKEKLVMMEARERKELKVTVWGKSQGLQAAATAFWLREENPVDNPKDREKLLSEIIWEKIKSKEEIFKTKFIECLENKFGKNIESFTDGDKETLVMMTTEERNKAFEIAVWGKSQSLYKIATACWVEGLPANNQKDREKLLSEIIWEKIKSKEEIFKTKFIERLESKFGKNIESFTDEDLEKLVMMSQEERNKAFEIIVWGESQSLNKIATACWVEGLPANIQKDREKLLSEIIWEKIKSKEEIFKTKFIERLESKFGKKIESFTDEDLEKLVMMSQEERRESFQITVWGESQNLDKTATACWLEKERPAYYQEDRVKLLSEIIKGRIKSKKELIKKYFTKDFPTAKEAKEKLSAMIEYKRRDYKISIQEKKIGLKGMTKDFWIEGDPAKNLEVLEKLIDTIWTYEPPEEKSLSLAKDSLQAHHCELNEETLLEEVNSTNIDEGAKVLQ